MKLNVNLFPLHQSASKMLQGTMVTIYKKPKTHEIPEGDAELLEFISYDPDTNLQLWCVQFKGEEKHVERLILIAL